ncbi:MAG: 4-hydroxy-tetrahydrodipicolinate synthase [bacterium]
MTNFGGVITAMVTPFTDQGEVHYEEACRLAVYLLDHGSDMILLAGTTGESPTLTHDEELQLFKEVVAAVKGKGRVMAGTGSNCTRTAIASSEAAANCGVDALLQVVPYYNKPPQIGLKQHFLAVAEATDLPVMLYNIPGRTGISLEVDTVEVLAQHPRIVAIKEASGSVDQVKALKQALPADFMIYSGDDALTLAFMQEGAVGVVSVAAHCAGLAISSMVRAFKAGNKEEAERLHAALLPLFDVLFITANPIPVKAALAHAGFKVGVPRLPLVAASDAERLAVVKVLETGAW